MTDGEAVDCASPPCYLRDLDPAYGGLPTGNETTGPVPGDPEDGC